MGAFVWAMAIHALAQVHPAHQSHPSPSSRTVEPAKYARLDSAWFARKRPRGVKPLVGRWRVRYEVYGTFGRRGDEPPIVSQDIRTRRQWIGEGRFIEDTTEGSLMGAPFWRRGWLGYSNIDQRYEWVTIDSVNPTMMIYLGALRSGPSRRST